MARPKKKTNRLNIRVNEEKHVALKEYAEKNNTTITKIIDGFLDDLLKDVLDKN